MAGKNNRQRRKGNSDAPPTPGTGRAAQAIAQPAVISTHRPATNTPTTDKMDKLAGALSSMTLAGNTRVGSSALLSGNARNLSELARPVSVQAGGRRAPGSRGPRGPHGSRGNNASSAQRAQVSRHRGPLLQFHPFPRLPVELRLKIWHYAMNEPRLIELEWGPDLSEISNSPIGSHQWHRVCPRSRQPPAVLHTNRESRCEALLVYSLRSFDTPTSNFSDLIEQFIYWNNDVDILFFGQKTCVSTLVNVFDSTHGHLGQPIKRVAIHMSGQIEQCCDVDDYTYGIDGGVDTMQALHGFDPEVTVWDTRYGGCTGLKEVTFVVPTKLWPRKQGEINDKCILLPTESNGLTSGQARFKQRLLHYIGLADSEAGIYINQGQNIWVGDNKPTFSFASIRPLTVGNDPKVCDGMAVSKNEMRKLARKNFEFFDKLQPRARCDVIVLPEEYPGEDPREIGLVSDKKGVVQAKQEILKFLGKGMVSKAGT